MKIEKKIKNILVLKGQTLSIAESCSGGLLGDRLTNISGSSKYFKGGFIVYANDLKIKLLKVPPALIKNHGAVSRPVAEHMAKAVQKILKTNLGVSITGIAGPAGGTKEKPIGSTFIAVSDKNRIQCTEYHFKGTRVQIKNKAAAAAMGLLLKFINS